MAPPDAVGFALDLVPAAGPWLARLALCAWVDPILVAVAASSAAGTPALIEPDEAGPPAIPIPTPAQCRRVVDELRAADAFDETAAAPGPTLREEVRGSLLEQLGPASQEQFRADLTDALARLRSSGDVADHYAIQAALWARQGQDWDELERLWRSVPAAVFLGYDLGRRPFERLPERARRQCPALSEAVVHLAGSGGPGADWDWSAALRTLAAECRLHREWADHISLDHAVTAGAMWLMAHASSPRFGLLRPNDAWAVHQDVAARIAATGDDRWDLSATASCLFHGNSSLVAIVLRTIPDAVREAELALADAGAHPGGTFYAGVSLALASLWTCDPAGLARGHAAIASVGPSLAATAPLAVLLNLFEACHRLDRSTAEREFAAFDRLDTFCRWLNLRSLQLLASGEYLLRWAEPSLALADFDAQFATVAADQSPHTTARLLRLRIELLLKAGQLRRPRELLTSRLAREYPELFVVPRARLHLCIGEFEKVLASTREALATLDLPAGERAQLHALLTVALFFSGAAPQDVDAAFLAADRLAEQAMDHTCFALLPEWMRDRLFTDQSERPGRDDCASVRLWQDRVFDDLAQGYPEPLRLLNLTVRERELLPLLDSDLSVAQIAAHLPVSINTVRKQITTLRGKFACRSRSDLVARARELGFL